MMKLWPWVLVTGFMLASAVPQATHAQTPLESSLDAESEVGAIGTAMFSWLTDQVARVSGSLSGPVGGPIENCRVDLEDYAAITHADLEALLVPAYIASLPVNDPWGNPYDFRLNVDNLLSAAVAAVRSAGSDGVFSGAIYDFGPTEGSEGDLVYVDGSMARSVPKRDFVSRQVETTETLRNLGTAWTSWLIDNVSRDASTGPAAIDTVPGARVQTRSTSTVDLSVLEPLSYDALVEMLVPADLGFFYMRCVPRFDGWGRPYTFFMNENLLATNVIAVRSAGGDGMVEGDVYTVGSYPADDFERDTVWTDGFFAQSPDGPHATVFGNGFESGTLWGNWPEIISVP